MKNKKVWGAILLAGLMACCLIIAISFLGNPIKKNSVSKEILNHLEDKYKEKFILVESTYDWKFGLYGGIYSPEKNQDIFFASEKYAEDGYGDFYPEKIWLNQVDNELTPIAKEIFDDYEDVGAITVWGIGEGEIKDGTVPNYKDISAGDALQIGISANEIYSELNKEELEKKIFTLIQRMKEISNTVGLFMNFENPKAETKNEDGFYEILGEDLVDINDVSDIKKYFVKL